jgi:hypothetical protein
VPPRSNRRTLENPQALEDYLRSADPPRWMQRLAAIDNGVKRTREELAAAYAELRAECGDDPATFAPRWRARLAGWRFDPELNELVDQHNEWFPIERQLPIDLRTRDYQLINGRSYRRPVLDAAWAATEFPPEPAR